MADKITNEQLQKEIEKIALYISEAKFEIAAIALTEDKTGNDKNIAHASSQLTEVVRHTEEATNSIMDRLMRLCCWRVGLPMQIRAPNSVKMRSAFLRHAASRTLPVNALKKC